MSAKELTPEDYISSLPVERQEAMIKLRKVILKNLPKGFQEVISYGMLGYVVPHSIFPAGYHCNPKLPLPFVSVGSQKNFIVLHHLGIYAEPKLVDWITKEYPKYSKTKLDMGKGCIRFKKPEEIPHELIGVLVSKISVQEWIKQYSEAFLKNKSKK